MRCLTSPGLWTLRFYSSRMAASAGRGRAVLAACRGALRAEALQPRARTRPPSVGRPPFGRASGATFEVVIAHLAEFSSVPQKRRALSHCAGSSGLPCVLSGSLTRNE